MWRFASSGATVIVESYAPMVITTWYGTADAELIDRVFDRMEAVYRGEVRIRVSISNVVELAAMPRASERRQMAERTERLSSLSPNDQATMVVMRSPAARAGLTAVQWLTRTSNRAETCATLEDAFERARRTLRRMKVPWPTTLDPTTYEVPTRQPTSAAGSR